MAAPDEKRMRAELRTLLQGVDLAAMSIGKLRGSLEQAMKLPAGTLDARKEQVNRLLQEELVKVVEEKKRKAPPKPEQEPANKKEKKEKKEVKEKKEKKEKDEKKYDKKEDKKEDKKDDKKKEEGKSHPEAADTAGVPPAEVEAAEPADMAAAPNDPTMGMSAFEDFGSAKPLVSRLQTWAVSGAEDGNLRLWDLESYSCVRVLEGHLSAIRAIVVDWEDMQALSGAEDNVRLWSLKRGGCLKTFTDLEEGCISVAADWKGLRALGGCGDGHLRLWNMTTAEQISSVLAHAGGVWALEAHWEVQRVASGGDEAFKVWDLADWACLHKIEGHPGGIMCLAMDWQRSRALIGVGQAEQSVRLWDLDTRKSQGLLGHRDAVATVRVDWEGDVALTGGWDAQLRTWNLGKGTCTTTQECKFGRVRSMAVDFTQMQALCGSSAGTLHFVDLHSGAELRRLEGHVGGVTALQAKF